MPQHAHITNFEEFCAKHEEMKEKWRNLSTGTILVCQCNRCERRHGLDHFDNHRAWQAYTTRCSCNAIDKSIRIFQLKHFRW